MERIHPRTGELFTPHRYRDGSFRVADPKFRSTKHHAANQIPVTTLTDLAEMVRQGFHVRMRGEDSGQINLVRPDEIRLQDRTEDGPDGPDYGL
ncbi:MAG: hypothetical protein AAFQ66_16750 [Pseudomonadota bacterium]